MYDQGFPIIKSGWNPSLDMLDKYDPNMTDEEIISDLDKIFGFIEWNPNQSTPEPEPETNWFEEDVVYARDVRTKK